MSRLLAAAAVVATLVMLPTPAPASGVTYDKLAYLTFNAPVQIPGATLNAGTYRFHLTNPDTSRNVLQVLSHDGSTVYAMFHTRPDWRVVVTDEPTVTFMEAPEGVTPPIKSLFYGGEHRGYEFVYPEGGPNMIAEVYPQPPITYTRMPAEAVAAPVAEPVVMPPAEVAPPAEPATQLRLSEAAPAQLPVELPRTATPLPLAIVGGASSLLIGLGLGLRRRWFA